MSSPDRFTLLVVILQGICFAQSETQLGLHTLTALIDGSAFAKIPAGEFMMGSREGNADEQPIHRVRISKPFELSRVEITQAQWVAVMRDPHRKPQPGEEPESINPSHFKGDNRPVEKVGWNLVQKFIEKMNIRDPEHVYRLPTEAEWEYAARAGSSEQLADDIDSMAWYEKNSAEQTHPVAQKSPNPWGLYDMYGNVQEWVQDWYGPEYYSATRIEDPQGPEGSSYKVYRGCAWLSSTKQCRPAFRAFDFPVEGAYMVGFRLVRTAK